MKAEWLIVGAGLCGCTLAERIANVLGRRVLVLERRNHIAGNAFDYRDEQEILVHKYGPHAFHTTSRHVWEYLSNFTRWLDYEHRVRAIVDGVSIPLPFNLDSLRLLFPAGAAQSLNDKLIADYGAGTKVPVLRLRESADKAIRDLAEFVYRKVFLYYTLKQWALPPEQLDPAVTARVPVLIGHDDRYFQDTYQGIPARGYTEMCRRMLDHPLIEVRLGENFNPARANGQKLIYTGPLDAFFQYRHGALPYRSLQFNWRRLAMPRFQTVAQVNYPNGEEFTRITEFKHMTGQQSDVTSIAEERPEAHFPDRNEPFYPIPAPQNKELSKRYAGEAHHLRGKVWFVGRLAEYRYYNMDQAVLRALEVFEKEIVVEH